MAFNTHLLDRIGAHTGIGGQKTFHVYTTTDSVATVSASGYFPSTEFKDGDVVFCSISSQVYAYTVSVSGSTVTVANAFANYSPSTETFPTWTGTPVPADGGWGVGYTYDLSPYLTNADSISISGEPAWMTVFGLFLVGVPNATGTTSNIIITPTNTEGDGPTKTVSVTVEALAPTWDNNVAVITTGWVEGADPDYDFSTHLDSLNGNNSASYLEVGSSLPASLTLTTAGVTDGTLGASTVGNYQVTISATGDLAGTREYVFDVTVTVSPVVAPTWSTIPPQDWVEGDTISFPLATYIADNGGDTVDEFQLKAGSTLPTTLTVNGTTGLLSGTIDASEAGTYNMTYQCRNSEGTWTDSGVHAIVVTAAVVTDGLLLAAPETDYGILFDDPVTDFTPRVEFQDTAYAVTEGDNLVVTVVRKDFNAAAAINQNVVTDLSTYFAADTHTANLAENQTSADVSIPTVAAGTDDGGETVVLTLSDNVATSGNITTSVTVTDAEAGGGAQFATTFEQVTEGETITLTVERVGGFSGALTQDVVVPVGTKYLTAGNYNANIADGFTGTTVDIPTTETSGDQGGETVTLTLSFNSTGNATMQLQVLDTEQSTTFTANMMNIDHAKYNVGQQWAAGTSARMEDNYTTNTGWTWKLSSVRATIVSAPTWPSAGTFTAAPSSGKCLEFGGGSVPVQGVQISHWGFAQDRFQVLQTERILRVKP